MRRLRWLARRLRSAWCRVTGGHVPVEVRLPFYVPLFLNDEAGEWRRIELVNRYCARCAPPPPPRG